MTTRLNTPLEFVSNVVVVAVLIFVLAPLVVVVAMSFSDSYFVSFPPQGFTLKWYAQVLQDEKFLSSLRLSAVLALFSTMGSLALGLPAAIALTRGNVRYAGVVKEFLLSPLVFPAMITGLSLLQLLNSMGSRQVWLNLWIGHVIVTVPYVVRNVITSLELVDRNLEDAARTLGASDFRTFIRITLPQIAPGVAAGALFAFMISFEDYPVSMWLADAEYTPVPMHLMRELTTTFDPSIPAMSTVILVLALVAMTVLERLVGVRRLAKV